MLKFDMDAHDDTWVARSAAALCVASRCIGVGSLALLLFSLWWLYSDTAGNLPRAIALSLAAIAGAGQIYLALRIEFDRRIFEAFARSDDAGRADFDRSLTVLGLRSEAPRDRTMLERARGLASLVKVSGYLLVVQFLLSLAAAWMK